MYVCIYIYGHSWKSYKVKTFHLLHLANIDSFDNILESTIIIKLIAQTSITTLYSNIYTVFATGKDYDN